MIWLNKLIRSVDRFYNIATDSNGSNLFKLADEELERKKQELKEKMRLKREELEKQTPEAKQEEQKKQEYKKQKESIEEKGRAALDKVNMWGDFIVNEDLYNRYFAFMKGYVEAYTRIQQARGEEASDQLEKAREQVFTEDDDAIEGLEKKDENIGYITDLIARSIPKRLEALTNLPYLVKKKTAEDAKTESESDMWAEDFSASEFLEAINDLVENITFSTQDALGDDIKLADVVLSAIEKNQPQETYQKDEGAGKAKQQGLTTTGNKYQQTLAAVRKYRALCREAIRLSKKKIMTDHLESALTVAKHRKTYEDALKKDPIRLAKRRENVRKHSARFQQTIARKKLIVDKWLNAKTDQEKLSALRDAKSLWEDMLGSLGLNYEDMREKEVMFNPEKFMKELVEYIQKYEARLQGYKAKDIERRQTSKARRGLKDLIVVLQEKINSRPNDVKRSITEQMMQLGESFYAPYKQAIEMARDEVNNAISPIATTEAQAKLKAAETALAKALLAAKEQLPIVIQTRQQLSVLIKIRDLVKAIINAEIVDNEKILNTEYTYIVENAIRECTALAGSYPNQALIEAKIAWEMVQKMQEMVGAVSATTPEQTVLEQEVPVEPAAGTPAGIVSSSMKDKSMKKKSRIAILQRIEKQALQDASVSNLVSRVESAVDPNLPGKQYADQVFDTMVNDVVNSINFGTELGLADDGFAADDDPDNK